MRFVDTNILVYAEQPSAGLKHERACAVLSDLWEREDGALSAQVLQELFVTITRKLSPPYTADLASVLVAQYLVWPVVPITADLVLEAIALQREASLSYWDAAIVAAAELVGADTLLSEDLSAGQTIRGVTIVNPLLGG